MHRAGEREALQVWRQQPRQLPVGLEDATCDLYPQVELGQLGLQLPKVWHLLSWLPIVVLKHAISRVGILLLPALLAVHDDSSC